MRRLALLPQTTVLRYTSASSSSSCILAATRVIIATPPHLPSPLSLCRSRVAMMSTHTPAPQSPTPSSTSTATLPSPRPGSHAYATHLRRFVFIDGVLMFLICGPQQFIMPVMMIPVNVMYWIESFAW
jgi:hypothetical protein